MAAPSAESVRGDFNDVQFKHQGVTSRFFKRGDTFFVRTDGPTASSPTSRSRTPSASSRCSST